MGPVLAAQFGYLPGALWILIGAVLGGTVQDFVILFCSLRRDGQSLGQMARNELNSTAGLVAVLAILSILIILLAVLALVVVNTLAESPWGVFTVGATIPIALFMGGYLRGWRVGKVLEASAIGVVLLLLAVWGGQFVYRHPAWAEALSFKAEPLAWGLVVYGIVASGLPIWLLSAPRDYLSTFMKLGTIFLANCFRFVSSPSLAARFRASIRSSPAARRPRFSRGKDTPGPSATARCAWNPWWPSWRSLPPARWNRESISA